MESTSDQAGLAAIDATAAFDLTVEVVREWLGAGKRTTSAGVKSALLLRDPEFDERAMGFESFADFLVAAEAAGKIVMTRTQNGYPLVKLPEDPQAESGGRGGEIADATDGVTFRTDVWDAFVTWRQNYAQLWDRLDHRPLVYPVDENGDPLWLRDNEDRFVQLPNADSEIQIGWMRKFALDQPEPAQSRLVHSLRPDAPRGEFARTLQKLGLYGKWRAKLQADVTQHIRAWAGEKGIPWHVLISERAKPLRRVETSRPAVGQESTGSGAASRRAGHELRAFLHRVIDEMSVEELSGIPIKAHYFTMINR